MFLILALMHFVIYQALVSIFLLSLIWRLILVIALVLLCLSFILISFLGFYFDNLITRISYKISAVWLGFAFYLFLVSLVYFLVFEIVHVLGLDTSLKPFGILCFVSAVIVSIYGVIHARTILVKYINVSLPHLPKEWEDKNILWVSDIHLGTVNGKNYLKKLVKKINEINPDIIFIGGDLYDGVKVDEYAIIEPLADLHPALGTYFITGNHEEFRDYRIYTEPIQKIGIRFLNNELIEINGLQLIGVDDRDSINAEKFKSILEKFKIDKNRPSILLKHQPSGLDIAEKAGVSLQISGHTHLAQVWPLNILTCLFFKGYDYGFHRWREMAVFTSSGVGTWGPPLRVGSDSEIIVFKFKAK